MSHADPGKICLAEYNTLEKISFYTIESIQGVFNGQ